MRHGDHLTGIGTRPCAHCREQGPSPAGSSRADPAFRLIQGSDSWHRYRAGFVLGNSLDKSVLETAAAHAHWSIYCFRALSSATESRYLPSRFTFFCIISSYSSTVPTLAEC